MANASVAAMGPPPSPKEPRRSGRRSAPSASTSKSPAGSPASDSAPKAKETSHRPSLSTSSSSSKNKRSKQEDHDEALEEVRKHGVNGNGNGNGNWNARTKRKGKEKATVAVEFLDGEGNGEVLQPDAQENVANPDEDDEEAGITRCICGDEEPEAAGEFMAQCEMCKAWQHGQCMGFENIAALPQHYYCEQCRPDLYVELLKKHAKRARQSSTHSHHTVTAARHTSRSSRSRSPVHLPKPTKRRNTMNSRDAAYEESFQALIEATAAEAAAAEAKPTTPIASSSNGEVNAHIETEELEVASNGRRKRKRSEDEGVATKRTRSASIASDRTGVAHTIVARDATPINSLNGNLKSTQAPTPMAKTNTRNRRAAARKSQVQDSVAVEGDEAGSTASTRRQANSRSKANTGNDNSTRRAQGNATGGHGASSSGHANTSAALRAYHHSHAYAVSQQPLFTSWNLPDYLAHLEPMLPTDIPRPLEVRGSGIDSAGRESLERMTERGVKVKWPSKRMSVGDMNKRVRSLVEWVGREQASALERTRRREALEKALRDARGSSLPGHVGTDHRHANGNGDTMAVDTEDTAESPLQEKRLNGVDSLASSNPSLADSGQTTMKLMEELMEELISFQERFGPGAKTKERERRTIAV